MEAINKTKTKRILVMEYLGMRTGMTNTMITERIKEVEWKVSSLEDKIEANDISFKENLNLYF